MFWFEKFPKILTQEEKIDYIYDELKKDESHKRWSRIWSWMWRIFLIASTYWLYLHPEMILDLVKWVTAGGNMTGVGGLGQPAGIKQFIGK